MSTDALSGGRLSPGAKAGPAVRVKAGATVFIVGTLVDPISEGEPPAFVQVRLPPGSARADPFGSLVVPLAGIALP
jgi:hypothetical protein